MARTVYVDLFFLINFSMDFLCFFLTSRLLGDRLKVLRMICACVIGGLYSDVALFIRVDGFLALTLDISVCVLMCLIVFGARKRLLVYIAAYAAVSMLLGGFMTALFSLLNRFYPRDASVGGDGISAWALLALAAVSAALSLFGGRALKKRASKKYGSVIVCIGGKEKRLSAFCDSGNLLRDPIGGKLCVPVAVSALEGIVPKDICDAVRKKNVASLCRASAPFAERIRLIPAKTAFGDGMLVALRADSVALEEGKDKREIDALIALCDVNTFGDGCLALLPSEILI